MASLIIELIQKYNSDIIKIIEHQHSDIKFINELLYELIIKIHKAIPHTKRSSLGRYGITKQLGEYLYPMFRDHKIDIPNFSEKLFNVKENDPFVRGLAVQLMVASAYQTGELSNTLRIFETASSDDDFILRECSQGFIRKLIKKYPDEMQKWYLSMVRSNDPLKRRFCSESLRPVVENAWFKKDPDYSFTVLKHLFHESAVYPRTSIGNNLSDWMRVNHEYTLPIIKDLANNGDSNSHWIAYRALRNYIIKEPLLVMDILKIDQYVYKNKRYDRTDYK